MRTALLIAAALLALPVHAQPPVAVDGDVVRVYVQDARSERILIERAAPGAGWADVRDASGTVTLVRVPGESPVAVGDRVTFVRDREPLHESQRLHVGLPHRVIASVVHAAPAAGAAPAMRVELRGDRVFIVAVPPDARAQFAQSR